MTTLTKNIKHKTNKHPKVPLYQYGVLITKPWSKEMYDHNDGVADIVKENLKLALDRAFFNKGLLALDDVYDDICTSDEEDLYCIAKAICGHGWHVLSYKTVYNDALRELERVQNFWLNEEYPRLVQVGLCPQVEPFFVGY